MNGCPSCRAVGPPGSRPGSLEGALAATLERSGSTVTGLLEHLAGEPVDADILVQRTVAAGEDSVLGLPPQAPTMDRAVRLTGRRTRRPYVYAETSIATTRVPGPVLTRLRSSRDPIGRVLLDERTEVRRTAIGGPVRTRHLGRDGVPSPPSSVLSRRYLILVDDAPALAISEWFLAATADAFAHHLGIEEGHP